MNSKQRTENVFNGRLPDRPVIGFFAIDSDTASKILGRETYWRAKAKSRIAFWEGRRDEVVQSWKEDGIELYKKLDFIDIIPVCCEAAGLCPSRNDESVPPKKIDEQTWVDCYQRIYRYSPVTQDITQINPSKEQTFKVEDCLWNGTIECPDESIFEVTDAFLKAFAEDRFVLGPSAAELAWFLPGSMETGLMELSARPNEIKTVYESKVAEANAMDRFYVRDGQAGVLWGTDLACQNGPMIHPKMYENIFLNGFTKRIANIKSLGQKVIKHMCGNNWLLLDTMAQAGIDCYQSVQESAGMNILDVHARYSDQFVIWGGVQVENLIGGTMEDVRKDVRRVMERLAPKGRFIFGTSHSVAVGTKYDNFMAMLDEAAKYI